MKKRTSKGVRFFVGGFGVQRVQKVQRVQRVQVRRFAPIFIKGDARRLEDRSQVSDVSQSNPQSLATYPYGFRWRLRCMLDDGIPVSSAFPSRGRCPEGADRAQAA